MSTATGALWYLWSRSFRNQLAERLKRLRQPRYAVALALGLLYMWGFLIRPRGFAGDPQGARAVGTVFSGFAQVGLLAVLVSAWLTETARLSLAFTPGEAAFLFPGPVTRRALLVFKLLRAQTVVILNVVLWVIILRRNVTPLPVLMRALAVWLVFTTLFAHRVLASLVRASWAESGDRALAARRLTRTVALAIAALLLWSVGHTFWELRRAHGVPGLMDTISAALVSEPAHALLTPIRLLIAPTFAMTPGQWWSAVGPAFLIMAAVVAAVVLSRVPYEEAAMQASAARADRLASLRSRRGLTRSQPKPGARRRTLPLAPTGAPEVALAWKNLLGLWRSGAWVTVLVLLLVWSVVIAWAIASGIGHGIGYAIALAPLIAIGVTIVFGPRAIRLDLRSDLLYLATLKTAPMRGRRIVLAEVAAATLMLTAAQWFLFAITVVATLMLPPWEAGLWWWSPGLVLLPLACLVINALGFTIQNGVVVLVPSWVQLGAVVGGGVEVVGQALLAMIASLLAMVLALVPALAVGVGTAWYAHWHPIAIAIGIAAGVVMLALELWGAIAWLGRLFDRMEPIDRR